ncbi:MAG: citrate transporter, partial [Moraxella sp.]|nr:citrate transporter [Moraxella sp.]
MLALFGLLIVIGFMILIMTRKASPFTSLILVPLIIGVIAGAINQWGFSALDIPKYAIAGMISDTDLKIKGVAGTALMLLFAILYFGLMLSAGLFQPLVNFIVRAVKGDPLKVLVGTAILALGISVDGDGSTTTLVVCSAMLPVYRKLNMKMMDLAVLIVLANSIMNLLPWGGPTARIITALHVDEGELLRAIMPGMIIAALWVIVVAVIRGLAERKRLGITNLNTDSMVHLIDTPHEDDAKFTRPHL